MDPIHFMPESKHCYDLIDEDLTRSESLKESLPSLDVVLGLGDLQVINEHFLSCCETGRLEDVQKLLAYDAGLINVKDSDGYSGLHRASYNGHLDVIMHLVGAGANLYNQTEDGWQALHCACRWSNYPL